MDDKEIRKTLQGFINEVFFESSLENAREIKRRFIEFCSKYNVTDEQLEEFTNSGAGEMLYMLASAPTK